MSELSQQRMRALVLFIAPVVLLVGFIYHPYVDNGADAATVAAAVFDDPDRFALAHLIIVVGLALTLLAVFSVRHMLRIAGEERWSFAAVPLLVVGGTLLAGFVYAGIALSAVANAGADLEAILDKGETWIAPTFVTGAILFALGWLSLTFALYRSRVLGREQTWVAVAAAVAVVVGVFIPATGGGYLLAVGVLVFNWLVGYHIWSAESGIPTRAEQPV